MDPAEVHFRTIALMRNAPTGPRGASITRGLAWHDGEDEVELRTDDEQGAVLCVIPGEVLARALPVTGRLAEWYPDTDFYIVVGDRFDAALNAARRERADDRL